MREAVAKQKNTADRRIFDINSSFIPISVIVVAAPVVVMSIQAFYKVDRATADIAKLTEKVESLGNDAARVGTKVDFIAEILKEVRENQKREQK